MPATQSAPALKVTQGTRSFWLTRLTAKQIVRVSYVARRGESTEEGAVQRVLNKSRISKIRDFAIQVGNFPASIILNWTDKDNKLQYEGASLKIPNKTECAQIIDGQHRVAGLAAAIDASNNIADLELPVAIYEYLPTKACADIFLSINTEQKPVPPSLVFDLYREASDTIIDPAAVRAGDLADQLNKSDDSPYFDYIKYPGSKQQQRGISLSTVVSTLKPLLEDKGSFYQVGLRELQMQAQFLINFFDVLRDCYGDQWESTQNAFRYSSGFIGAIEFIKNKLLIHCNLTRDFSKEGIAGVFALAKDQLILQSDVKGLQGRKAYNTIAELLDNGFTPTADDRDIIL